VSRAVAPALAYVGIVFAAAFALGIFRTLWLAPRLGDLAAVALEVPVVLALSWLAAGAALRRWPLPRGGLRLAMGAMAFSVLMGLEATVARAFGQSLAAWAASLATPAGALGLAGQLGFAAVPALRR
jgi:hypothetical protein